MSLIVYFLRTYIHNYILDESIHMYSLLRHIFFWACFSRLKKKSLKRRLGLYNVLFCGSIICLPIHHFLTKIWSSFPLSLKQSHVPVLGKALGSEHAAVTCSFRLGWGWPWGPLGSISWTCLHSLKSATYLTAICKYHCASSLSGSLPRFILLLIVV